MAKTKQKRLEDNYTNVITQYVQGRSFTPMRQEQLFEMLQIHEDHYKIARKVVTELIKEDVLKAERGKLYLADEAGEMVLGEISVHPRGFAFVRPENASQRYKEDIFIPKHLTKGAVDGDRVEVAVNPKVSAKGPEGEVIAIVERGRTHLAGTVTENYAGYCVVYAPLLGREELVEAKIPEDLSVKKGDRVILHMTQWAENNSEPCGEVSQVLGNIKDPTVDIPAAIEEYEIRSDFSSKALEESAKYGTRVKQSDLKDREELRDLECFTIDPDTAKDFDDACSLSKDNKGHYHLGVHIADVSHYVRPGTTLDEEASFRCNSTYFPGRCVPMIPPQLSDHLCSLRPNVNRLAASVLMEFDKQGSLVNYRMTKSVIKSRRRFTYKEALQILEGKKQSPFKPHMELMVELCGLLKNKRFERGSIDLAVSETIIKVDDEGMPTGTEKVEYDITHQLIEEFMLKANEVVATHLTKEGLTLPYRIHDAPDEEKLLSFAQLAEVFGFKLPSPPSLEDLQRLFEEAKNSSYGEYLATLYIRSMKMAYYSPENVGHYGLSLEHYCHFTSPIRRYADLVTHRLLFDKSPPPQEWLGEITHRCSEQERVSARAENAVILLKKLRLIAFEKRKDPQVQYEAVVTSVRPFGVAFEVPHLMLEGFFHVRSLGNEYYVYNEKGEELTGEVSGQRFARGEKITVSPLHIDLVYLEVEWDLVSEGRDEGVRRGRRGGPKRKKGASRRKRGR